MQNLSRILVMIIGKDRNVHEVISQKYKGCHWTTNLDLGDELQTEVISVISCHHNPM